MAAFCCVLVAIFILELALHWQLSRRRATDLVDCSNTLQNLQRELSAMRNISKEMRDKDDVDDIGKELQPQETKAIRTQHELSAMEIFRRFVLQPPAPANVPYSLHNEEATYYSRSDQDRIIDAYLKHREKGFFVEVNSGAKHHHHF
jgi:hypothetical protein